MPTRATIDSKEEFYDFFTPKNSAKPEIHGGFALAHWNGSREVEEQIKSDLKVTIRCIPLGSDSEPGRCIFTGEAKRAPRDLGEVILDCARSDCS